jgi:hypothetical protein
LNNKVKNGSVNLLVHGLLSSRYFFYDFAKKMEKTSESFLEIGVITYRKELDGTVSKRLIPNEFINSTTDVPKQLQIGYSNKDFGKLHNPEFIPNPIFSKLTQEINSESLKQKINLLTNKGYHILLRFEGSHINPSTNEVSLEVEQIINKHIPRGTKLNLVGHSRGGLAVLKCAMNMPDRINKVVTINTPYSPNVFAYFIGENKLAKDILKTNGLGTMELSGKTAFLNKLRHEWNFNGYKNVDLTAIGIAFGYLGDGIVDTNSQLANYNERQNEYKNLKRITIKAVYPSIIHGTSVSDDRTIHVLSSILLQKKELPFINRNDKIKVKNLLDRISTEKKSELQDLTKNILRYSSNSKEM